MIGGSGVWGAIPMTPHPALKEADIKEMLTYIMSLK
jgi:cytochrome c